MNVLEKILEEIEDHAIEFESFGMCDDYVSVGWAKEIIHSHMDEVLDNNDGWIPVVERLPEDGKEVLCTDGKYIYLVEYDADLDAAFGEADGIIAWQPLPEPYKEEADENRG